MQNGHNWAYGRQQYLGVDQVDLNDVATALRKSYQFLP
jgi:hypothetical protein